MVDFFKTLNWRKFLRSGVIAVLLAIYSIAFAETFLRVFAPQVLMPRYITGTPWGVRGNIPHAVYWHRTSEGRVQFRINGEGMRDDREFSRDKPAGTCRVVVLGDSFFVGYEVDLNDAFVPQLEKSLRKRGFLAEVLNFSVSGFGTAEMLRAYMGHARSFNPDVVLFEWHQSDLDDNVRSRLFRLVDGRLNPDQRTYLPSVTAQDALMASDLYRFIADNSHLYSLVREKTARLVKRLLLFLARKSSEELGDGDDDPGSSPAPIRPKAIGLTTALLERARDEIVHEGREFYVVEVPRQVSRMEYRSTIDVLPEPRRAHFNIISPVDVFNRIAGPNRKLYFETRAGHLTPEGVGVLVEITANMLTESSRNLTGLP